MPTTDLPTVQTTDALLATGAVLALLAILFVVVRVVRHWRAVRSVEASDPPPLLIPVQRRGSTPTPLYPARFGREGAGNALRGLDAQSPARAGLASAADDIGAADHGLGAGGVRRNGHGSPAGGGLPDMAPAAAGATTTKTNGGTASKVVHTIPPMDGTLQFLPGRLEVIDGDTPGRDVRFVRTWGEVPEITFGRVTGPPYRHVQLRSQTVSRQHARMQYVDGRWKMTNLSQTNPVIINGEALETAHGTRVLRDGDQIEMGEVVFRFRER
jgi:hypothetical protein